jgi:hypothetical protein
MERILTKLESDAINLQSFWADVYPNWPTIKAKLENLQWVYNASKKEQDEISDTMDRLMAEWGFKFPKADDPNVDKYFGIVFKDEDAYQWFLQHWK